MLKSSLYRSLKKKQRPLYKKAKREVQLYLFGILVLFGIIGVCLFTQIPYLQQQWSSNLAVYNDDNVLRHRLQSLYPKDGFSPELQRKTGGIFHFLGMLYMFLAISLLCDEFFVPAIEVIVDRLELSPDVAGATWMAAGGSAPELFTSFIGSFVARSNVGFGTIVGSAVFNVLFVIGCCAVFTPGTLPLTWWPFARDSIYYTICLIMLAMFFGAGWSANVIQWWESVVLLLLYGGYCIFMANNERIHLWFLKTILRRETKDIAKDLQVEDGNEKSQTQSKIGTELGMDFHLRLFSFMTKDKTFDELAAIHVIQTIKGTLKETFDKIDIDKNGVIDKEEFTNALQTIQINIKQEKVDELFNQVDLDKNGQVEFNEFQDWYLKSELRLKNDIQNVFRQYDRDDDNHVDATDIKGLLMLLSEGDEKVEPTESEIKEAMETLDPDGVGRVNEEVFINWYLSTGYYEKKKLKRQQTLETIVNNKEEEEEEDDGIDLTFPKGIKERIFYIISIPIILVLVITLPNVKDKKKEKFWPITFIVSILWLGCFSFLMVWWATICGTVWGIPDEIMGLTFLAAGTSVPDLLTSVIVAKRGHGDMAVSSSIGSNIFDILIGLPLPWLLYAITIGKGSYPVAAESLFFSIIILVCMLLFVLITIKLNNWTLTHCLGYMMFVLYVVFVIQDIIRWKLSLF